MQNTTSNEPSSTASGQPMSVPVGSPKIATLPILAGAINTRQLNLSSSPPCVPDTDAGGRVSISQNEYIQQLDEVKRKSPLRDACNRLGLKIAQSATLQQLRSSLANHWYPASIRNLELSTTSRLHDQPTTQSGRTDESEDEDLVDDEVILVAEFGVEGADADEILGFDDESDDEDNELYSSETEHVEGDGADFEEYKRQVRVDATQRSKMSRRAGGIKTQAAIERDWKDFIDDALATGKIQDDIVDEHSLLCYIQHSAERPKRTTRGKDIVGTYVGASQLKKLYFGVLRIRKEQEADDPTLKEHRPATSQITWDAICGRMNEAARRARDGEVPGEDAPDIIANTFLSSITDEQMAEVGKAFLKHRELRSVINGHLAWTGQHATGNRGDDFRALKLAELQPYTYLHPNKSTSIHSVLGLQGEEKAGGRGMRSTVNPVYSVFITHLQPEMCPLGAFAFYHHFIHDVENISAKLKIDWTVNKSWRQIRVLHGKKSPTTPYNEQSLYKLYVLAFKKVGFISKIKAHLPRHILGYRQEKLGVDGDQTSKMGWVRGQTYHDKYAPALPKDAILAAHGYRAHEPYDPPWRQIHVPEKFLKLVCPMAEDIYAQLVGKPNLTGAANYWKMVIDLRPYLFQCGAAIYQICPESSLFKLPALADPEVRQWMKHSFPPALALVQASAGAPIDLANVSDPTMQRALTSFEASLSSQSSELVALRQIIERRTAMLSPTKSFSMDTYHQTYKTSVNVASSSTSHPASVWQPASFTVKAPVPSTPMRRQHLVVDMESSDELAVYPSDDGSLRAFVNESPKACSTPRAKTQVDLVLPPTEAFSDPGSLLIWPPVLGRKSVTWEEVFNLIKQPNLLWDYWRPTKTLDQYSLEEQWACYSTGEFVSNAAGIQTGIKPPLRLVELYFQTSWRKSSAARKAWQRFREIPEWIDQQSSQRHISPAELLHELEEMRTAGGHNMGLSALTRAVKDLREENAKAKPAQPASLSDEVSPLPSSHSSDPSVAGKKRKAAPVDPRRRPKKAK